MPIQTLQRRARRAARALAATAARHGRVASALHEFACFGVKQASACLFGGLMVALLFGSFAWYPANAPLARYDFLTLAAVAIQALLLATRLETRDEAVVIAMFHVVGTVMELFKTAAGSWTYPEPSLLRLGEVPLFSGFMYASVGSYIARAWRLFDFRFTRHPPPGATWALALAIYLNFFGHHFIVDLRGALFVLTALLFGRTWVHFRVVRRYRRMPLLLGFVLVAGFIWIAENAGTFSRAWLYPAQRHGWTAVPLTKLGAWLLLMIVSYALVAALHRHALRRPVPQRGGAERRAPQWAEPLEKATIGVLPRLPPRVPRCSPPPCALPATTTNWPRPSPPNEPARKTTSS